MIHPRLWLAFLATASLETASARADSPIERVGSEKFPDVAARAEPEPSLNAPHPTPRIKLSYRGFAISDLDRRLTPLEGLELDLYPLSGRWLRAGFALETGRGRTAMAGNDVDLRYGLAGVVVGLQFPARLTPFVEGRLTGGMLAGTMDGALTVPGTSYALSGGTAATWIYGRGVDVGAELYTIGRLYLSGSVGWLHTTWRGVDVAAMTVDPLGGVRFTDLTGDSFTFKLGVGF